jgi:hypothetical protein
MQPEPLFLGHTLHLVEQHRPSALSLAFGTHIDALQFYRRASEVDAARLARPGAAGQQREADDASVMSCGPDNHVLEQS